MQILSRSTQKDFAHSRPGDPMLPQLFQRRLTRPLVFIIHRPVLKEDLRLRVLWPVFRQKPQRSAAWIVVRVVYGTETEQVASLRRTAPVLGQSLECVVPCPPLLLAEHSVPDKSGDVGAIGPLTRKGLDSHATGNFV